MAPFISIYLNIEQFWEEKGSRLEFFFGQGVELDNANHPLQNRDGHHQF
ncbi:hypothetical protein Thiowin_03409 [Thiorhodovibrio winogradskyi]|uniref:Uncharacterized protein n=1 Tax=Thiorhodovibrio winogradskyi TaxID=77007 RepID=A0ABZ0SBD3_9GAMM|nr:hypothetical protein [Thiorhodovibrio winogradskyi]